MQSLASYSPTELPGGVAHTATNPSPLSGYIAQREIAAVLDGAGFGSALARLVAAGRIAPVRFVDIPIYEGATHAHEDDRGQVMVFCKT